MSNGDPLPPCPECKVVINGGVAARVLDETCDLIYHFTDRKGGEFDEDDLKEMIVMANKLEDDVFRFQRKVLESTGFKGPWPHSLDFK